MGPPGRPPLVQPRVDTDNFPDRPLARIGTGTLREPHPQRVAEMLLQARCCRRYEEGAEASLANRRGLPKANAMDR